MTSLPRTPDGRVSLRPEDYPPKGYGKGGFFDISPQPPKYYDPLATPFPSSPTQPPGPITGGSFPTQQRLPRWQTQEEQYYEQPQSNEVVGTGYSAGGVVLTGIDVTTDSSVAVVSITDAVVTASTITARGGLIYNSSQANKAIAVFNFGSDKSSSNGDFTVQFPTAAAATAIIRIKSS